MIPVDLYRPLLSQSYSVFLAKTLDSSKFPNRAKENFIEDDHIVLRMVESFDAILLRESDAKELVDRDAIRSVFLC